jgi:hypothetical protein
LPVTPESALEAAARGEDFGEDFCGDFCGDFCREFFADFCEAFDVLGEVADAVAIGCLSKDPSRAPRGFRGKSVTITKRKVALTARFGRFLSSRREFRRILCARHIALATTDYGRRT